MNEAVIDILTLKSFKPTLHNDLSIEDEALYNKHNNLIKTQKYSDATTLLTNNSQIGGAQASLFNSWEKKILELEVIISLRKFINLYFDSDKEPIETDMKNKVIWQQEY